MISSPDLDAVGSLPPVDAVRAAWRTVHDLAAAADNGSDVLRSAGDAGLIDVLIEIRRLRSAIGSLEAHAQATFDSSVRDEALARGVPKKDAGKGIAEQVALARGVSPHRAANDITLAKGLTTELPRTLALLTGGALSEHAALNVARETVCLMTEDRALVDERLAEKVAGASPRRASNLARAEAARVDPESVTARIRMAEKDRNVTLRPAPDAMVYLSGLLPVKDGVAAYAALLKRADDIKACLLYTSDAADE